MTSRADSTASSELEAARILLARLGITPEQLLGAPGTPAAPATMPTFSEYIDRISQAVTPGTLAVYSPYWNRVREAWGNRLISEPTPLEIKQLAEHIKSHTIVRRNTRGGRSAAEHLIGALRCLYRHAVDDGLISERDNPAMRVAKPRRLASNRRALLDAQLEQINIVAATTGNDPDLDTLLIRLHTETACRRGGALALRPFDLDQEQCLIRLREKGETERWQPVSPTLMSHLLIHGDQRGADDPYDQLLRYRTHQPIHQPPLRPPLDPARPAPALGRRPADQHPLAALHHPHLGRTPLRLRHRPRLRRPQRPQRQRHHRHLRARRPLGSSSRSSHAHR